MHMEIVAEPAPATATGTSAQLHRGGSGVVRDAVRGLRRGVRDEAPDAMRMLDSGQVRGKVVLTV
jgi:hypothetical protein